MGTGLAYNLAMARAIDHEMLLDAVPVRNPLVRERAGGGPVRLTAPLRATLLKRMFGSKHGEKSFDLDELGAAVWKLCDGRRTVEEIISAFAQERRVNVREAQVAVVEFLRMLLRRNLIAMGGGEANLNLVIAITPADHILICIMFEEERDWLA